MVIELKRVTILISRLFCRGEMEEVEEEEDGRRTEERESTLFIGYIRCIRNLKGSSGRERRRDMKFHSADSL